MAEKAIIIYYSQSGTTKQLAELIKNLTGADTLEIQPLHPYSDDYKTMLKEVRHELDEGIDHPYLPVDVDLEKYDTVFIGTPNWGGVVANPLATFLKDHDFSGKKIIPFLTHGGAGEEDIEETIDTICPNSDRKASYLQRGKFEQAQLESLKNWLDEVLR
ncbi:MAG: flavodoxin [Bacillota bacterium]|nr:flavodoxin [Bacillota bacterium]